MDTSAIGMLESVTHCLPDLLVHVLMRNAIPTAPPMCNSLAAVLASELYCSRTCCSGCTLLSNSAALPTGLTGQPY